MVCAKGIIKIWLCTGVTTDVQLYVYMQIMYVQYGYSVYCMWRYKLASYFNLYYFTLLTSSLLGRGP